MYQSLNIFRTVWLKCPNQLTHVFDNNTGLILNSFNSFKTGYVIVYDCAYTG